MISYRPVNFVTFSPKSRTLVITIFSLIISHGLSIPLKTEIILADGPTFSATGKLPTVLRKITHCAMHVDQSFSLKKIQHPLFVTSVLSVKCRF